MGVVPFVAFHCCWPHGMPAGKAAATGEDNGVNHNEYHHQQRRNNFCNVKKAGGGQGGPNMCGKIKQRQKMGSTTLTLTTTTNNNKNNKPRCYPQQRFGISFRYSFNEKI